MKLITLNTWGGRAGKEPLLSFFKKHKDGVDIFCLQEVFAAQYDGYDKRLTANQKLNVSMMMNNGMQDIRDTLGSGYATLYHPHFYDLFGLMMVAKQKYSILESGDIFVHKHKGYIAEDDLANHARNIQYAKMNINGKSITIVNFHGLWNGKGKTDSEERILQSKNIISFLKEVKGEIILCGDFNLRPDTKSIALLEDFGLRNLITEYGVTSTRTSYYKKEEKFADYVLVTKGVEVKDFKVLPDEVSDHSALLLEFE